MKKLSYFFSLGTLALICTFNSCVPCGSGGYSLTSSNRFGFYIVNKKTNQNILVSGNTEYVLDSVEVHKDQLKVPAEFVLEPNGYVGIYFVTADDKGKVDQTISRRFYMYFTYQDIDTIDIDFKTHYDECDKQRLKYFKVAYNDSIYYDGSAPHDEAPGVTFLKEY